jgi:carbamoyltransferase
MRYVGWSEYHHDAGFGIIEENGDISFATQSERYSKVKNDNYIHPELGKMVRDDDILCFFEDANKQERTAYRRDQKTKEIVPFKYDTTYSGMPISPTEALFTSHHVAHAALAMSTRPWDSKDDTVILTIDGVGEDTCSSIYSFSLDQLHKVQIPKSIGMIYSYVTEILGLRPLEDEYVVMGMAAYGKDKFSHMFKEFYEEHVRSHRFYGRTFNGRALQLLIQYQVIREKCTRNDIAASVQAFAEQEIFNLAKEARKYGSKLVYAGGVAQNVVANTKIRSLFDDVWIPPCPTDGGSGLGAAAYFYCKDNNTDKINWQHPYLGYEMPEVNPSEVVEYLLENKYCGVASGQAEFGPRALGNRSLIADVRYDVKDTVNTIKRRQKFRPFAPAILEEFAEDYFDGPMNEYMQYVAKAKHDYSSVIHVDGTSRVQVVKKDNPSVIRKILEEYYEKTGVPMLLNTSLNIRGKPIVNDKYDAHQFEIENKTKVFYK